MFHYGEQARRCRLNTLQANYRWPDYCSRYGLFSSNIASLLPPVVIKVARKSLLSPSFKLPYISHSKAKFALRQSLDHLQRSRRPSSLNDFRIRHVSPHFSHTFSRLCFICPNDPQCELKIAPSNPRRADYVHADFCWCQWGVGI